MKYLRKGNLKLPKTTAIFNLPSVITCLGSTKWCRENCYAKKAEKMYPNVLPFRYKCLALTKDVSFIETINNELKKLNNIDTIRIHESGDFYSQDYLDDWISIMKTNPLLNFYAYTKSYNLDFSEVPKNCNLFYSVDTTTIYTELPKGIKYYAFTSQNSKPIPALYNCRMKLCWNKEKDIPLKCKECNFCYKGKPNKSVIFFKH
jgi:hypothetical protein